MTKIVVDEELLKKLHNLENTLELCNQDGIVLARVVPKYDPALYEGLEPTISREELERRKQDKGKTYTINEVIAHLESL